MCIVCDKAVLGAEYKISGGKCRCGTPPSYPASLGTYIGINDEGFHVFEIKVPYMCQGCHSIIRWDWVKCEKYEEELDKLFNINQYKTDGE